LGLSISSRAHVWLPTFSNRVKAAAAARDSHLLN